MLPEHLHSLDLNTTVSTRRVDDTRPAEIVDLVHACMSDEPANRPRIGYVYEVLSRHAHDE